MGASYRLPFNNNKGGWSGGGNWDDPSASSHGVGQPYAWDIGYSNPLDPSGSLYGKVYAARAGTVIDLRNSVNSSDDAFGPGNYVLIRHADNTIFAYDHLKFQSVAVNVGQYVEQGTMLAIVGNTGSTSGGVVHLHMEAHSWWTVGEVGNPSKGFGGTSLPIHFEDSTHAQPCRPVAGDVFGTHSLQYRQDGWRFCHKCAGLYFSYQGANGTCPADLGPHATQGGNYTLSDDASAPGQPNWKYCRKCRGLFFAGNPGSRCPVTTPTNAHDGSTSNNYRIINNLPGDAGQHGWRYCHNCKGMWFGSASASVCPHGGVHSQIQSGDYSLALSLEDTQQQWRFCYRCNGLFFKPNGFGVCPEGGAHSDKSGGATSGNYTLCVNVSPVNATAPRQHSAPPDTIGWQGGWRYCHKCGVLWMGLNSGSRCPADGAAHSSPNSGNYYLLISNGTQGQVGGLGQVDWRWCSKCQGLWFSGLAGSKCPTDGLGHSSNSSSKYVLMNDDDTP